MSLPHPAHRDATGDTRTAVLEAALHLFSTRGYFKTSIHDIRRASGVSIGSIYHHFRNKEALAKALYDHLLARLEATVREVAQAHASAHDRCRAIVARLFELTESEPETIAFVLHARHREYMPEEPPICSSAPFTAMREMVAQGMNDGELPRMDPGLAAACLFGGPLRVIHLRLDGMLSRPLPQVLDEVWSCAWQGLACGHRTETRKEPA